MKNTLRYTGLWQKKRRELPVKGNPNADWLQMSAILDRQMPVSTTIKKPSRFKLPKWGLHVLVGVSIAGAIYVCSLYFANRDHVPASTNTQQVHRDSITPAGSTLPARDSISPVTGGSSVNSNVAVRPDVKANFDKDSLSKQKTDSTQSPAILNVPFHRDSLITPVQATPQRLVRDSIGTVDVVKKNAQKDSTSATKKPSKKKKRTKFSVFF